MSQNNTPLQVPSSILMLERGNDELLLANHLDLRPLYVRKGSSYIKKFLEAASQLGTYGNIVRAFPGEVSLLDMLMEHRIIVKRGPLSLRFSRSGQEPGFENKRNISLYLLIAQSCNMGCVYCLNGRKTYHKEKALMMSKEVAFRSIERCLDSLNAQGFLEIIFFGGEPLLNWPLAKEIITYCENCLKPGHKGKNVRYHFTSNLSFLPADLIEWAKRYNITFLCDVDGPGHVHDLCRPFKDGRPSHAVIAKNIESLASAGIHVLLRATVTALNHDHLTETSKHHKDLGGKSSALVPVNPFNSDEDILDEGLLPSVDKLVDAISALYRSKLWNEGELYPFNTYAPRLMSGSPTFQGCGAPYGNTPVVTVNGDVYPCIYLVGIRRFFIGNITNGSYPDRKLLRWMYDYLHVDNSEDCKSCSWRYTCSGACPMGRLMVLDKPAVNETTRTYCERIRCDYTRKIFELILWEKGREAAGLLENKKPRMAGFPDVIPCL